MLISQSHSFGLDFWIYFLSVIPTPFPNAKWTCVGFKYHKKYRKDKEENHQIQKQAHAALGYISPTESDFWAPTKASLLPKYIYTTKVRQPEIESIWRWVLIEKDTSVCCIAPSIYMWYKVHNIILVRHQAHTVLTATSKNGHHGTSPLSALASDLRVHSVQFSFWASSVNKAAGSDFPESKNSGEKPFHEHKWSVIS